MTRYLLPLALASSLTLAVTPTPPAMASAKRALIIGIDTYQPEVKAAPKETIEASKPSKAKRAGWIDLDGCVNDATSVRDLMVAKYGFAPENVVFLKNREATRARILAELQALGDRAGQGDTVFFYYAGHGSQVTNSASPEADKKDETIVPADAPTGTPDIRDKELRGAFNHVLDKGAVLTAVFDSCHSGSVTRGHKNRNLPPDPRDVADASGFDQPSPEERGALVLSAALDQQTAGEAVDERDTPHGAFTLAFLKALTTSGPDTPVDRLYLRIKAQLQSEGRAQEPVLSGNADRRSRSLLGDREAKSAGKVAVAVLRHGDEGVELQGGLALGLRPGCELVKVGAKNVRLRLTAVDSLSKATAKVVAGNPGAVQPGDLFEVDRWVIPNEAVLKVWAPTSGLKLAEVTAVGRELAKLKAAPGVTWVEDPSQEKPTHTMVFEHGWKLYGPDGQGGAIAPTAHAVSAKLAGQSGVKLFVSLPVSSELSATLKPWGQAKDNAVALTSAPGQAHYHLVGRMTDSGVQYAWWLPDQTLAEAKKRTPLPVRTDWVDGASGARQLQEFTARIAKLKAWLQVEVPGEDEGSFPYRLALRRTDDGSLKSGGRIVKGESYGLALVTDQKDLESVEKRFVYVFSIDSFGNSTLLFPRPGMGGENRVPFETAGEETPPAMIPIGPKKMFRVTPPYGLDTYVMLTSLEAIPNPEVLEFQGVRTRGKQTEGNGLQKLLFDMGAATRGARPYEAPASWSVQRVVIESAEQ